MRPALDSSGDDMEFAKLWREIIVVVVGGFVVAIAIKYADIPTRVSVIESKQTSLETAVGSIDKKLDIVIEAVKR